MSLLIETIWRCVVCPNSFVSALSFGAFFADPSRREKRSSKTNNSCFFVFLNPKKLIIQTTLKASMWLCRYQRLSRRHRQPGEGPPPAPPPRSPTAILLTLSFILIPSNLIPAKCVSDGNNFHHLYNYYDFIGMSHSDSIIAPLIFQPSIHHLNSIQSMDPSLRFKLIGSFIESTQWNTWRNEEWSTPRWGGGEILQESLNVAPANPHWSLQRLQRVRTGVAAVPLPNPPKWRCDYRININGISVLNTGIASSIVHCLIDIVWYSEPVVCFGGDGAPTELIGRYHVNLNPQCKFAVVFD